MKSSILPLRVTGLCYEVRGRRLLGELSFELEGQSRSIVLGPNGAGKSLTLRLCHGLLEPSSGTVSWNATDDPQRHQAMVFQRPVMLRRSAGANIRYALALRGVPPGKRQERAMAALERAGLTHLADRPARQLSIGEQQRLALARAWALEPEVLMLDEPTANLDPAATRTVEAIITAIAASGTKIIMTTHDLGQARRLADEVLFLHGGKLLEQAPAARFFAGPRTAEARAFLDGELLW